MAVSFDLSGRDGMRMHHKAGIMSMIPDGGIKMTREERRETIEAERERVRATANWQAYKRRVTQGAYRLQDAPSQVLAGVGVWRRMTVCPRTGAERVAER